MMLGTLGSMSMGSNFAGGEGAPPAPSNLITDPNDFTTGNWTTVGATTSSGVSNPDTDPLATSVTGAFNPQGQLRQNLATALTVGVSYTLSGFAKAVNADATDVDFYMFGNSGSGGLDIFKLNASFTVAAGWTAFSYVKTIASAQADASNQQLRLQIPNTVEVAFWNLDLKVT